MQASHAIYLDQADLIRNYNIKVHNFIGAGAFGKLKIFSRSELTEEKIREVAQIAYDFTLVEQGYYGASNLEPAWDKVKPKLKQLQEENIGFVVQAFADTSFKNLAHNRDVIPKESIY